MKKEMMDILACPGCKGELELRIEVENDKEIITGSLFCQQCNYSFPIIDAIPNLLLPDNGR